MRSGEKIGHERVDVLWVVSENESINEIFGRMCFGFGGSSSTEMVSRLLARVVCIRVFLFRRDINLID